MGLTDIYYIYKMDNQQGPTVQETLLNDMDLTKAEDIKKRWQEEESLCI